MSDFYKAFTRRNLLQKTSLGLGSMALGTLLNSTTSYGSVPSALGGLLDNPHHKPRAKSVIYLHMVGAPSHLDLLEHKPMLNKYNGKPCPDEYLTAGQQFAFIRGHPTLLGTKYKFERHGKCGMEVSELLPHLAQITDEICVVKTVHTEEINHGPAQLFQMTGFGRFGRPSLGSWVSYGLGSENSNLPSFVVMVTGNVAGAGSALWGPGFLPAQYQGVEFRTAGEPVLFLSNPKGVDRDDRRRVLDSVRSLNQMKLADLGDPAIAARIEQYELAFRMQSAVPDLMDLSGETQETLDLYGIKDKKPGFATNCLLARRLVERGVRFVQLFDADWDTHANMSKRLAAKCKDVDQGAAALVLDLKRRGLLEDTLVVWGGEFGRTPVRQSDDGRDHHKDAYALWMAGGGVKSGFTYGQTDDIGFKIAENPVHVHDLHATILHLLGIDHKQLTYRFQGRDFRLTDVAGNLVKGILA